MSIRKVMGTSAAAAVVAVGLATAASADGMARSGAPGPYTNWSGFYVGGHLGGAWSNLELGHPIADHNVPAGVHPDHDAASWLAGGQIGLQHQFGRWVVGAELSLSGSDLRDTVTTPAVACTNPCRETAEVDHLFLAVGRLGYAHGAWHAYVKGGYANGVIRTTADDGAAHFGGDERRHDGWTVGGGLEWMIKPNIILGVEYNYVDLGSKTHFDVLTGAPGAPTFMRHEVDAEIHTVAARLSFKIDRDREPKPMK